MATINWNKPIFPDSFKGFVDSTFTEQNTPDTEQKDLYSRLQAHLLYSKQIDFDGVIINEQLSQHIDQSTSENNKLYLTLDLDNVNQLDQLMDLNLKGVNINFDISKDINHISLVKIKKLITEIKEYQLNFRIILTNFYTTPVTMLADIIQFFISHNASRISIYDKKDLLNEIGIKNLFKVIYKEINYNANTHTKFEFACASYIDQALSKSIAAIDAGVSYIHTTIGLEPSSKSSPSLFSLLNHYSDYQAPLNVQYTKQKLQFINSEIHPITSHTTLDSSVPVAAPNVSTFNPAKATVSNVKPDIKAEQKMPDRAEDLSKMEMIFTVSADSWHVCLTIKYNNRCFDLGERVHHYVLLLMAQEYTSQYDHLVQRNMEIDPINLGWAERETLRDMIGDNETQFNVKICRAKKQICDVLGLDDMPNYSPVSTRKGSIRLDCGNVTIIRGSKIESRVHQWHQVRDAKSKAEKNVKPIASLPFNSGLQNANKQLGSSNTFVNTERNKIAL
ncbi:hypothetical protein [Litoribacillus peritrichatus]|uniref:Uncharacterized protein n=1 Tax=Litoribacillus peritrichatus TaxID=718191 RepID=A0ABP7MA19_9GAMM